jgi:hypothetical protein
MTRYLPVLLLAAAPEAAPHQNSPWAYDLRTAFRMCWFLLRAAWQIACCNCVVLRFTGVSERNVKFETSY